MAEIMDPIIMLGPWWIGVGRPLELDIEGSKTRHCKRTFGIRHRIEFGIRPLEIDIITSARWQMKNSYY